MRSSNSVYLANLDHLRLFAAYLVFIWHFTHFSPSCPGWLCQQMFHIHAPFFSLLEQGYTGIALFMCISGYIFTYLTDGEQLQIGRFWWNRLLRLFPLLLFWGFFISLGLIKDIIAGHAPAGSFSTLAYTLLHPQSSWTIYLELQYYLALPLIMLGLRRFGVKILVGFLLALTMARATIWFYTGSVQTIANATIIGRGDQFLLGTVAFYVEQWIRSRYPRRGFIMAGVIGITGMIVLYQYITILGGYEEHGGPLFTHPIWIVLPTLEGLFYSLIIISYLQWQLPQWINRPLSAGGRWSYSIYLDHPHITYLLYIFGVSLFGMPADFYARLTFGTIFFVVAVVQFSALTYALIEKPFLRLRVNYLLPKPKNP